MNYKGIRHLRGARLISPGQLTSKLYGWTLRGKGLWLGNVKIPHRMEYEHLLILGSQGSGKSSLVRAILQQIEKRGQIAIVVDPECEFVQEFYRPERGDFILNPLDERAPFWSPWLEFRNEQKAMDVQAMCSSLVRGKATRPEQMYWQTISRRLLEKLFHQTTNLQTLMGMVEQDKTDARTGATNALWPLSLLPTQGQTNRSWAAVEWARQRQGWLFLTSTEDSRPAINALQGIWLDLLIRRLMSGEIFSEQTWVVADEVATMGYQPQLEQSLITRGRKRGLSVVLSLQNIAQLRAIYGHDPTMTLAAQPGTMVLFKCREPETARWCSELIGEHEVKDERRTWREPLVLGSEIQTLPKFQGYVISGEYRAKLQVKKRYLKAVYPSFIHRQVEQSATMIKAEVPAWFRRRFAGIKGRCAADRANPVAAYAGKGVRCVYESAEAMFRDLGLPPDDGQDWSVDRIDPARGYESGNVRWANKKQQTDNRQLSLRN